MNRRNPIKALLSVCVLASMLLCACHSASDPASTAALSRTAVYQVKILDVDDQPVTEGAIVRFLQDGREVAMQETDATGVATKELTRGEYTVQIMFLDPSASYYYDTADLLLSATKTELTVSLAHKAENPSKLYYGSEEAEFYEVYQVRTGRTFVQLQSAGRSYFLFVPQEAGVYRLSVEGEGYAVGYYGSPDFIRSHNIGQIDGDATSITVSPDMLAPDHGSAMVFVIGVDNPENGAAEAMLQVERVSAYVDTEIPTRAYQPTGHLTPWTLPENARIHVFDLRAPTNTYKLVLNETTGFYHLGSVDGPLVLMCLGEMSDALLRYAASFDTVLQTVGVNKYFTDGDGNYTYKEDYSQCLRSYIGDRNIATGVYTGGCVDRSSGLYPLTRDLMYILQQHGDYAGWWDISRSGYLFRDADGNYDDAINPEIAWLFMCVYISA